MITGFYLAQAALKTEQNPLVFSFSSVWKRIKKIAIPYYFSWLLCFIGKNYVNIKMGYHETNVFDNFMNSFYELFFLKMFGFKKGFYSNSLGWFFSALLIVSLLLAPLIVKFKKTFLLYVAPVIVFVAYGILSIDYDYLHSPNKLIQGTFIMRGLVRAFAAICVGCILHAFVKSDLFNKWISALSRKRLFLLKLGDAIVWTLIVVYCVYPHDSVNNELITQYDFLCVFAMAIAMIPVLAGVFVIKDPSLSKAIGFLGVFAFYGYFGQAIFYSFDQLVYQLPMVLVYKFIILFVCVIVFTFMLWGADLLAKKIKARKALKSSENAG